MRATGVPILWAVEMQLPAHPMGNAGEVDVRQTAIANYRSSLREVNTMAPKLSSGAAAARHRQQAGQRRGIGQLEPTSGQPGPNRGKLPVIDGVHVQIWIDWTPSALQ